MVTVNTTKTDRLLQALKSGQQLTAKQAASRFGFSTPNSVRAAISNLRFDGYAIYANERTNSRGETFTKYRLGTPSRAVIAAGYRALAGS